MTMALRIQDIAPRLRGYGEQLLKFDKLAGAIMTTPLPHPRGGLYFEDFAAGQVFHHRLTRTFTQMDNMLFSNMTLNPQP